MEKMDELLDQYQLQKLEKNQIVEGKVIKIGQSEVIVDIGYKQEAFIPLEECLNYKKELVVSEGSYVKAMVKKLSSGEIVLSKKNADSVLGWEKVKRCYQNNTPILAPIVKRVKRGYIADIGIELFLPDSHADVRPVKNPDDLLGKEFRFKILKLDESNQSAVVSRKVILIEEQKDKREKLFATIKEGDIVNATIRKVGTKGAIAELESSLTAFIPKSEISWGYLPDIRRKLKADKTYKFKVIEVNKDKKRIILSYKAFQEDPWIKAPEKYKVGTQIRGRVIGFRPNYAIVELEEGVNARLSGDDVYWGKRIRSLRHVFEIEERIMGKVIDIFPDKRIIHIGLKQLEESPWDKFGKTYKEGDIVDVKVKKIAKSGVIVNIMPDVDGFIRKGDLQWGYVEDASEVVKEGDTIKAMIMKIEEESGRILLGVKQLEGDKWQEFFSKYKEHDIIETKVKKIMENFIVVEFLNGLEGIIRKREITTKKIENIEEIIKVGESKEATIISIEIKNKKVLLSYRKLEQEHYKKEMEKLRKVESSEQKTTIGDLIKKEIMNKKK
jgi:small subunit ribosomal protein S1